MKKLIFTFILISLINISYTQDNKFGINFAISYNSYNLNNLKEFLYYSGKIYHENNVPVKVEENFPNYISGRIEFYIFHKPGILPYAFYAEYYYTPGIIKFSDPSLKLESQFILSNISFGIILEIPFLQLKRDIIYIQIRPSIIFNSLKINEKINSMEVDYNENINLENTSFGGALYISYRSYFNNIAIQPFFGYQLTSLQPLHLKGSSKAELKSYNNKPVPVQWNGFRIGLAIGIEW